MAVHSSLEVVVIPCTATGADLTGAATVSVSVETSATEEFTTSKTLVTTAALSADDLNKGAFGMYPYLHLIFIPDSRRRRGRLAHGAFNYLGPYHCHAA